MKYKKHLVINNFLKYKTNLRTICFLFKINKKQLLKINKFNNLQNYSSIFVEKYLILFCIFIKQFFIVFALEMYKN